MNKKLVILGLIGIALSDIHAENLTDPIVNVKKLVESVSVSFSAGLIFSNEKRSIWLEGVRMHIDIILNELRRGVDGPIHLNLKSRLQEDYLQAVRVEIDGVRQCLVDPLGTAKVVDDKTAANIIQKLEKAIVSIELLSKEVESHKEVLQRRANQLLKEKR
jgi:hypothetical protein